MVLMAHEYLAPARECFRQAESLAPREVRWVYFRAFTHLKDDPARAVGLLDQAVSLDNQDAICRLRLADTLLGLGRASEAERHYLWIADHPNAGVRARLGLARVALSRDELAQALEHARQAAQTAPTLRGPLELLAAIHLCMGDEAAAAREQTRAADLVDSPWHDPYLDEVMRLNVGLAPRLELAQRLLNQAQGRDAVTILEMAVADYPESVPAWLSLVRARLRLGQPAAAQAAVERALRLSPNDALAWADLGTALALQEQWDRAADCYHRSIQLNPQDGDTPYQLAFCHLRLADRAAAERSFRESLRLRPHFGAAWRELGRLLGDRGENAEAETCLQRAVELSPADEAARKLLSEVRARLKARNDAPDFSTR
jgi:tetratricopeptide (TPR) repeat protein